MEIESHIRIYKIGENDPQIVVADSMETFNMESQKVFEERDNIIRNGLKTVSKQLKDIEEQVKIIGGLTNGE